MKNLVLILFIGLGLVLTTSSCQKSVFSWDLIILNETSDPIDLFVSVGGGDFHYFHKVAANGSSRENGNVFELKYKFEARKADGTLVSSYSHQQNSLEHEEITWKID